MCYSILVEQDLKSLEKEMGALVNWTAFGRYQRLSESDPKTFKNLQNNPRIYPYYFAPITVVKQNQRVILPMRYRLRPKGTENEVPNKYNLYNARLDSLRSRSSWRHLLGKQHGLLAFRAFFEWVEGPQQKKKVIQFSPLDRNRSLLIAPVLFDIWVAADQSSGFASFAVITTEPFADVAAAGHDRSPIILPRHLWSKWLQTDRLTPREAVDILSLGDKDIQFTYKDAT